MIKIGQSIKLSIHDVIKVAHGEKVSVDKETLALVNNRRSQVEKYLLSREEPAYGFNRGFGHNVDQPVEKDQLLQLQKNYVRSHSSGLGEPAPVKVVRAAMLARAHSLSQGQSGVRGALIEQLIGFLNAGITPVVPLYGSVGASGDLAPLAHIALALTGEGDVFYGKSAERLQATEAIKKAGLSPLELQMKEGLALTNGVQFSNAFAILASDEIKKLLKTASVITSMSTQVLLGSDSPFLAELHELRPHRGAQIVSSWIAALMKDSPIRRSHDDYLIDGEVQDPYTLRCAGQVLGTCHSLIEEAQATFEVELNSVTDNPLMLKDPKDAAAYTRIVSGGHFHGMPVAVKLFNLLQAMAIISSLSNTRCARYVDEARNRGLGNDLIWPGLSAKDRASSSGMMVPEYGSAALSNLIVGQCMPSHLFSVPTDAGQEDHVSMCAGMAVRVWQTIPRLADVLAIELAFASQAAAIRKEKDTISSKLSLSPDGVKKTEDAKRSYLDALKKEVPRGDFDVDIQVKLNYKISPEKRILSPVCEKLLEKVYAIYPPVKEDRTLSAELNNLSSEIAKGTFLKFIENEIPLEDIF